MAFGQGRSGGGGGRGRGDKKTADKAQGQRRPMFRRRKVCKFCADKIVQEFRRRAIRQVRAGSERGAQAEQQDLAHAGPQNAIR